MTIISTLKTMFLRKQIVMMMISANRTFLLSKQIVNGP